MCNLIHTIEEEKIKEHPSITMEEIEHKARIALVFVVFFYIGVFFFMLKVGSQLWALLLN